MRALHALAHALLVAGSMTWEILWALILGFILASVVRGRGAAFHHRASPR